MSLDSKSPDFTAGINISEAIHLRRCKYRTGPYMERPTCGQRRVNVVVEKLRTRCAGWARVFFAG